MHFSRFLLLGLALALPAPRALAAPKKPAPLDATACPGAEALSEKIQDQAEKDDNTSECDLNAQFARAGTACLDHLEAAIKAQTGALASKMAKSLDDKQKDGSLGQAGNLGESSADYAAGAATLGDLLSTAEATRGRIDAYLHSIFYPSDFDAEEPEVLGGSPIEYLDSQHCYVDNESALKQLLERADRSVADMKKSLAAVEHGGATAVTRTGQEDSITSAKATARKPVAPKAAKLVGPRAGHSKNSSSDITGTQKKKTP